MPAIKEEKRAIFAPQIKTPMGNEWIITISDARGESEQNTKSDSSLQPLLPTQSSPP
jgi:hypothetical protein